MTRSSHFTSRAPFRHNQTPLEPTASRVSGPFSSLNPTSAHFHTETNKATNLDGDDSPTRYSAEKHTHGVHFKWTSRNNRKGRHALVVPKQDAPLAPRRSSDPRVILHGLWDMIVKYPVWDVSWWVAYIFTWGSIIWCINALFSFLPFVRPNDYFPTEALYGGGITAFIGATVFVAGSVFLMLEAVNEERAGCFGWAVEQVWEEHEHREKGTTVQIRPDNEACTHHHSNKQTFLGTGQSVDTATSSTPNTKVKSWTWWPSTHDLKTHYLHELGFLACLAQMVGATIFWIAGFTALPGINNHLSTGLAAGVFWVPQIVGGSGFIISGTLFMIETQSRGWYVPAPRALGWWIGLFNLIGGVGFTLCPCFGLSSSHWCQYQAALSTFWASWSFLIGSVIQLYESLEKHPVEVESKTA